MNYLKVGNFGLALDSGDPEIAKRLSGRIKAPHSEKLRAHFVLERYVVDDDGNVCLTPALPIDELPTEIESIRAVLESLLRQARERCSQRCAPTLSESARM